MLKSWDGRINEQLVLAGRVVTCDSAVLRHSMCSGSESIGMEWWIELCPKKMIMSVTLSWNRPWQMQSISDDPGLNL